MSTGRPAFYPWDEWLDGRERTITREADYPGTSTDRMRSYLYARARGRGLRVTSQAHGDSITFRVTDKWEDKLTLESRLRLAEQLATFWQKRAARYRELYKGERERHLRLRTAIGLRGDGRHGD